MARISKELIKRCDGKASLAPRHVIVVRVASFAFRFETVERLRECIKYYEKKTRASSRIAAKTGELEYDINGRIHFHRLSSKERWLIDHCRTASSAASTSNGCPDITSNCI